MLSSVVIELQRDALDRNVPVTDLLRKALVVARKLKIKELELWINKELAGYGENEDIPGYRMIRGQVKGWNPYHGWQPVVFGDVEIENKLSETENPQAVSEIESLISNNKGWSCNPSDAFSWPRPRADMPSYRAFDSNNSHCSACSSGENY